MARFHIRIPYFRVWYNFFYAIILLILFGLLVVTPFDHIYQTFQNGRIGNVFVVAGTYLVTALIAIFIYFSRIYTNRTVLAAIPRSYLPIEKKELSKNVWAMVVKERQRSALIAWDSRPRDIATELEQSRQTFGVFQAHGNTVGLAEAKAPQGKKRKTAKQVTLESATVIPINPSSPPWGDVYHPGWSAPSTLDIPFLHFATIIVELPNLLEAKAVSLAPDDPAFGFLASSQPADIHPPPDPQVVALLQRQSNMGMREYLGHLHTLGMIHQPELHEESEREFLTRYEYARYSVEALTEHEFRILMARFSGLLSRVIPLPQETLDITTSSARRLSDVPSSLSSGRASTSSILRPYEARTDNDSMHSTGSIVHHTPENDSWDAG